MAKEDNQNRLKIIRLMSRLSKTYQGGCMNAMQKYIVDSIKNPGNNIEMPTLGYFVEKECTEYGEQLLTLYNGTFGLYDGVNDIPDDLKISQASLLDGLMYGYDVETETVELYTMNPGLLNPELSDLSEKNLKDIMEKNKVGLVKAFRVDVEYCQDDVESVEYKLVNHRKPIDDSEKVFLVPYIAGLCLAKTIDSLLRKGMTLKTVQYVSGTNKARCITVNPKVLVKYCDSEEAVQGLTAQFFPLKSFFYAPVLGAPSTTAMVTNIDFFRLEQVKRITEAKQITEMGIQKPKDPTLDLAMQSVAMRSLMNLKSSDQEEYFKVIEKLPKWEEIMPCVDVLTVMPAQLSNYLHTLKRAELKKVVSLLPNTKQQVDNYVEVFGNCHLVTEADGELTAQNVRNLLKNHLCRFIIRKKDYHLSSITCTNNSEILSKVYGEDYFNQYESVTVRARVVVEEYSLGRPLEDALASSGFSTQSTELIKQVLDELMINNGMSEVDALQEAIGTAMGVKKRAPAQTGNIMVRTVDAYFSGADVVDYYRYLDVNKIEKMFIYK